MLSCYRIIDLTDDKGSFCGKVLGDLGADVIKVEKPGGDAARNIGPYFHDDVHPEKSLNWLAFNASKRGITLDIETKAGREIFKKLVKTADAVIESFPPGYMAKLGLDYNALDRLKPGIILTSISPFGQEGTYRDYKVTDIVIRALGGLIHTVGDTDRPPLTTSYHHSYLIGAMHAAVGTMIALYQRALTGKGQLVDAPIQLGLTFVGNVESHVPWMQKKIIPKRNGKKRFAVQLKDGSLIFQPMMWKCIDGYAAFTTAAAAMRTGAPVLIECMKKDGIDASPLEKWDWNEPHEGEWTREEFEAILDAFGKFFSRHTKAELLKLAQEKGVQLGICLNAEGAIRFPQLVERGFWKEVEHPELGAILTYPGAFARFSDADCGMTRRAPLIGEHNGEIYKELSLPESELKSLKKKGII